MPVFQRCERFEILGPNQNQNYKRYHDGAKLF